MFPYYHDSVQISLSPNPSMYYGTYLRTYSYNVKCVIIVTMHHYLYNHFHLLCIITIKYGRNNILTGDKYIFNPYIPISTYVSVRDQTYVHNYLLSKLYPVKMLFLLFKVMGNVLNIEY